MGTKYFFSLGIGTTLTLLSLAASAYYQPAVICGATNPAGNLEVAQTNITRGGFFENQLLVRNKDILEDFISKGAINRNELNDKGEFIIKAYVENNNGPYSANGIIENRHFTFIKAGNGFLLSVRLIPYRPPYENTLLADFYFNDCETFKVLL